MTVWGDEFGRSQNGNKNPYNIDSVATWNNYDMIATRSPHLLPTGYREAYHNNFGTGTNQEERNPLFIFAAYIAHLRQNHIALKQHRYGDMVLDAGNDVTYLFKKTDGVSDLTAHDRSIWFLIDGSAVGDHDFLVLAEVLHPLHLQSLHLPPQCCSLHWCHSWPYFSFVSSPLLRSFRAAVSSLPNFLVARLFLLPDELERFGVFSFCSSAFVGHQMVPHLM